MFLLYRKNRLFIFGLMKLSVQYLNDTNGTIQAVQLPIMDWEKIQLKMKKYEQILRIKSDLTIAFSEVTKMRRGELKKQTLSDFLDEV